MPIKRMTQQVLRKALKVAPKAIRGRINRHFFELKEESLKNVEFKIALTFEQKIEAMKLVQDAYIASGLSSCDEILRISKFHFLPTTYTFIAMDKNTGSIVGTMSIIYKTSLGLPVFEEIEGADSISKHFRSCEVISLAVKPNYRSKSQGVFLALAILTLRYAYEVLGVNSMFISVRNNVKYFYEDIFFFEPIAKAKLYPGVNNVYGIPLHLFIEDFISRSKKSFKNRPLYKNMYKLFMSCSWSDPSCFEKDNYGLLSSNYFTTSDIDKLRAMVEFDDVLDDKDMRILNEKYFIRYFESNTDRLSGERIAPRFDVNLKGEMGGSQTQAIDVLDVSRGGFRVILPPSMDIPNSAILSISIKFQEESIAFRTTVIWKEGQNHGLSIRSTSNTDYWHQIVDHFEHKLHSSIEGTTRKLA